MHWQIYLSGEIHTDWRERIAEGVADAGLDPLAPVAVDLAGEVDAPGSLGHESDPRDRQVVIPAPT